MTIKGLLPTVGEIQQLVDDIMGGIAEPLEATGFRSSISNAVNGDDIWTGTATTLPIPPSAGQQMDVVSTSAQDGVAGTGILTLDIHYLDANGLEQDEHITMNGVTPVTTVATNIRFVQVIHTLTVGTNLAAVGTITIFPTGVPATVYNQIIPGMNKSLNTARMVPAGKVLIIRSFNASGGASAGGKSADIRLRSTSHHGILLPVTPNGVFILEDNFLAFNSGNSRIFEPPIIIPAFAVVKCTAFATAGGADVQASWRGVIVPTPV
jgi:hypothetical protein